MILRLTAIVLAVAIVGIGVVLWLAWPWLPVAPDAVGLQRLSMVILMAVIAVTFSPTMAAAVTTETGARGRLSELVLPVVVLADLALLVLFSLAMQFAREVQNPGTSEGVGTLVRFAWEIGWRRRVRLPGGRRLRVVSPLCRTRSHARADRRVHSAQPCRLTAAVRAAAGGGRGRCGHREPRRSLRARR